MWLLLFSLLQAATIAVGYDGTFFVPVHEGKSHIEVYSYGDQAQMSCLFYDPYSSKHLAEEKNTHHCVLTTNAVLPAEVGVLVHVNTKQPVKVFVKSY